MRSPLPALALIALTLTGACAKDDAQATRPNLLVLLVDDVGIDQFASYDDENRYDDPRGYAYPHLPSVDALAARGVRFTQCRSMPVCSPTRASILSGQYPFRHGVGRSVYLEHASDAFREFGTPPAPRPAMLPEMLSAAGYRTAAIGKWHLALEPFEGGTLDGHPLALGFDEWRGTPRNFVDPGAPAERDGFSPGYHNFWWVEDGKREQVTGVHASRHTVDRAIDWIRTTQTSREPWFAYVAFNACHAPMDEGNWPGDGHGFGAQPASTEHRNTRFRATLEHLDTQLGRLLDAVGDDTLVVFLTDNGSRGPTFRPREDEVRYPTGHARHRSGDERTPLTTSPYEPQRMKQSPFEGGIRVPLIVAGPGVDGAGRASDALVDCVDLVPTLLALSGSEPAGSTIDGLDFSPVLRDAGASAARDWSFSEYFFPNGIAGGVAGPNAREEQIRAYLRRDGPHLWKVVHALTGDPGTRTEVHRFYHVAGPPWIGDDGSRVPADPLEQRDLGRAHPEFRATRRALANLVGER